MCDASVTEVQNSFNNKERSISLALAEKETTGNTILGSQLFWYGNK